MAIYTIHKHPVKTTDEEQLEEIEAVIEKLEDDDDVQKVYTNLA